MSMISMMAIPMSSKAIDGGNILPQIIMKSQEHLMWLTGRFSMKVIKSGESKEVIPNS